MSTCLLIFSVSLSKILLVYLGCGWSIFNFVILITKFKLRAEEKNSSGIFDTFILFQENKKKRDKIIKILGNLGFGTKNLPDAMEWHCSYFWDHALDSNQVKRSKKSYDLLKKSVAIPILKNKKVNQYIQLGKKLSNYA